MLLLNLVLLLTFPLLEPNFRPRVCSRPVVSARFPTRTIVGNATMG